MKKKFKIQNWVMSVILAVCSIATYAQTPTTDLTTHQPTAAPPIGTTFEWHVGISSSSALVGTPSAVAPGLYYGFYNYGSACFSEAAPIRIITNTCPTTTVDLNIAANAPPSGSTLSFHYGSIASDANEITGTAITAAGAGTYFVAYKTTVNSASCYSQTSPIVVVVTLCCPVLTNSGTAADNINPITCGGSNGSIKICGLVANSTGSTINYDKNATAATPLTNQTADASGCIVISGLTAGTYTNIKVTNASCPSGSNAVSATLTNPAVPVSPTATSATPTSVCSGLPSTLSGTCSIGTLTWYSDPSLTTAVGSTVNPVSTTTYYGSCVSGTCKSPSVAVVVTVTPCANPDASPATAGVLKNIPILTNDKNPDGTSVTDLTKITTPTIANAPSKGTVTLKADGSIDYTPNPGTSGTDTFIYSICDKTNPTVCDTAKVTVTISPAPAPAANPDASPATAGVLKNIPILTNDINPDGSAVTDLTKITTPTIATAPTKGTVTLKANGSVDYTPNPGTSGTDTFSYTICDKSVPNNCSTAIVSVVISPVLVNCNVTTLSPSFIKK